MNTSVLSVTLYGLAKCSTCVKAQRWLKAHEITYVFIDYRAQPLSEAHLTQIAAQLGSWDKLINRASMTWRALLPEQRIPSQASDYLVLIAQHPTLIRRPLLIDAQGTVLSAGFNEKSWSALFNIYA